MNKWIERHTSVGTQILLSVALLCVMGYWWPEGQEKLTHIKTSIAEKEYIIAYKKDKEATVTQNTPKEKQTQNALAIAEKKIPTYSDTIYMLERVLAVIKPFEDNVVSLREDDYGEEIIVTGGLSVIPYFLEAKGDAIQMDKLVQLLIAQPDMCISQIQLAWHDTEKVLTVYFDIYGHIQEVLL